MTEEKIICIRCPRGCNITLTHDDDNKIISVTGNTCERGDDYARKEFTNPVRTFTSTVKINGGDYPLCSVKSETEIPKGMMDQAAIESCKITIDAPINIGDVVAEDFCGTGVNLVATRDVKRA